MTSPSWLGSTAFSIGWPLLLWGKIYQSVSLLVNVYNTGPMNDLRDIATSASSKNNIMRWLRDYSPLCGGMNGSDFRFLANDKNIKLPLRGLIRHLCDNVCTALLHSQQVFPFQDRHVYRLLSLSNLFNFWVGIHTKCSHLGGEKVFCIQSMI